jgi:hypothetical protein
MRRSDKEIRGKKEMEKIIRSVNVCRVGFVDGNKPYVLPFNFGYSKGAIYIHCAMDGKKLDLIRKNSNVFVEIDTDNAVAAASDPCNYGFRYRSVLSPGKASVITGEKEKVRALGVIMRHITGMSFGKFNISKVASIRIIKVVLTGMTGKKSGYN